MKTTHRLRPLYDIGSLDIASPEAVAAFIHRRAGGHSRDWFPPTAGHSPHPWVLQGRALRAAVGVDSSRPTGPRVCWVVDRGEREPEAVTVNSQGVHISPSPLCAPGRWRPPILERGSWSLDDRDTAAEVIAALIDVLTSGVWVHPQASPPHPEGWFRIEHRVVLTRDVPAEQAGNLHPHDRGAVGFVWGVDEFDGHDFYEVEVGDDLMSLPRAALALAEAE